MHLPSVIVPRGTSIQAGTVTSNGTTYTGYAGSGNAMYVPAIGSVIGRNQVGSRGLRLDVAMTVVSGSDVSFYLGLAGSASKYYYAWVDYLSGGADVGERLLVANNCTFLNMGAANYPYWFFGATTPMVNGQAYSIVTDS